MWLVDIAGIVAVRPMALAAAAFALHTFDHSHAESASPWIGFLLHLFPDASKESSIFRMMRPDGTVNVLQATGW